MWGSEHNVSSLLTQNNASAWTFSGAACAYAGLYIPIDPTKVLNYLGMDLLTIGDYIGAMTSENTIDITNAPKIASCKGAACNVGADFIFSDSIFPAYVFFFRRCLQF